MPKAVTTTNAHTQLTTETLNLSVKVLTDTMRLDPWEEDPETGVRKFNGRINGQRVRAALGTLQAVVHLGDQALKRQAGTSLKALLADIKKERQAMRAKVVEA